MKTGRPKNEEPRELLVLIAFKADKATLDSLAILVDAAKRSGSVAPKSTAIRGAIQEAAERIRPKK